METRSAIIRTLGISDADIVDAQWADNGPGWIAVLLSDAEAVLRISAEPTGSLKLGVVGAYPPGSECDLEVRAFFPSATGVLFEDPVTGSLYASVAQCLLGSGRIAAPYVASQGTVLGRAGRVHVTQDGETIRIGGDVVTCVAGTIEIGRC